MDNFTDELKQDKALRELLSQIVAQTKKDKCEIKKSELVRKMVSAKNWVNNPYYVGLEGEFIYPYWKQVLVEFFDTDMNGNPRNYDTDDILPHRFNELILTGGLGTGKSTFANFMTIRKLYELSCYKNVNALFKLMPSSIIALAYLSVNMRQAELGGYGALRSWLENIPYFNEHFPFNKKNSSLVDFTQNGENIVCIYGSSTNQTIGLNLISCTLDEANFYGNDNQSNDKSADSFGKVTRMYAAIVNRTKSRFLSGGRDNSLCILISSNTTSTSFTEQRIQQCLLDGKNSRTKIVNARVWEVKPKGTYSDKVFWVFKGSAQIDPLMVNNVQDLNTILGAMQEPLVDNNAIVEEAIPKLKHYLQELFIAVPVDFKKSFEQDVFMALQDIAGVSIAPMGRLFSSKNTYLEQDTEPHYVHPFTKEQFIISTGDKVAIKDFLIPGFKFRDLHKPHYIHIDQSFSNDSTGFSMCHIEDWYVNDSGIYVPVIGVDIKLRINPPKPPKKISLQKIVDFVFYLRDVVGIEIGFLTMDSFSSQAQLQAYEEAGIPCKVQSVDRTCDAYLNYVELLFDHRIHSYLYEPERKELFDLILFREKHKVDHPSDGSKDCTDAIAGALFNAVIEGSKENPGNFISNMSAFSKAMVKEGVDDEDDLFTFSELTGVNGSFKEDDDYRHYQTHRAEARKYYFDDRYETF